MSSESQLIDLLASGEVCSGTEIGAALGVSRVAVKKRITSLCDKGMPVTAIQGKGYRLIPDADLLSDMQIRSRLARLDRSAVSELASIEVFQQCASTSGYLKTQELPTDGGVRVVLTEHQPEGQGRRGRGWQTTPYRNLMMTLGKRLSSWPPNPAGLSLAFAVAVHQVIATAGAKTARIKWPNDILVDERKIAGLLVDASGEASGGCDLLFGVGINFFIDAQTGGKIDQPWHDMKSLKNADMSRNQMAAGIIANMVETLDIYEAQGFKPFQDYWNTHSAYVGEDVRLFNQQAEYRGSLRGVDENGVLTLDGIDKKQYQFTQADVSLRPL